MVVPCAEEEYDVYLVRVAEIGELKLRGINEFVWIYVHADAEAGFECLALAGN